MIQPSEIQFYLRKVFGSDTELVNIKALGEEEHDTGNSKLLHLEARVGSQIKHLILRLPASTVYGTEHPSDRAHAVLQAYDLYKNIPRHPRALDVAIISTDGTINSIPVNGEFALLQEFGQGELYLHSLMHSLNSAEPDELAERHAVTLAEYLLDLHSEKVEDDRMYRRSLRDLVSGGVGVMGIIGGYTEELRETYRTELDDILRNFISLAWSLERSSKRLCRIHGDFHPLNILFDENLGLTVIDASGTGWGDAAFDVGILFMNYYALYNTPEQLSSPSGQRLAERFLSAYTARCEDLEGLYRVLPLALARGALIMATTDHFPHRPMAERERLIRLAGDVLSASVFIPSLFSL